MYGIRYTMEAVFMGDGVGPMTVPSAQRKEFAQSAIVIVPGANAPSAANFNTAIDAMAVDLKAQVLANLVRLQGFATGGG